MSRRTERVNDLIREEVGDILLQGVRDPRLTGGMLSVTDVQVSPDLRYATVAVSCYGGEASDKEVQAGLDDARAYVHRELRKRLRAMRRVPELRFELDATLERAARLTALIREHAPDPEDADKPDASPDA